MDIGDYLIAIAEGYKTDSVSSQGHKLLRNAALYLSPLLPGGLQVVSGGGQGRATSTPWVAVLDPDETSSPQRGIYLVYIFHADLQEVELTLNQGITETIDRLGRRAALVSLESDAESLRSSIGPSDLRGLSTTVEFGSKGYRQRAYEAGNIASITYEIDRLPSEDRLESDLTRMVNLYQAVVDAKRRLLQSSPGVLTSSSRLLTTSAADPLLNFRPKSEEEYIQHLTGRLLVKSRRHEKLVRDYGLYAATIGLSPSTAVHPRDMTLTRENEHWLVEAKVLYQGNATLAVREALGQLSTYEYFLYPEKSAHKVALFTEPIGESYVEFLEHHDVASVWKGELSWEGSSSAAAAGLT